MKNLFKYFLFFIGMLAIATCGDDRGEVASIEQIQHYDPHARLVDTQSNLTMEAVTAPQVLPNSAGLIKDILKNNKTAETVNRVTKIQSIQSETNIENAKYQIGSPAWSKTIDKVGSSSFIQQIENITSTTTARFYNFLIFCKEEQDLRKSIIVQNVSSELMTHEASTDPKSQREYFTAAVKRSLDEWASDILRRAIINISSSEVNLNQHRVKLYTNISVYEKKILGNTMKLMNDTTENITKHWHQFIYKRKTEFTEDAVSNHYENKKSKLINIHQIIDKLKRSPYELMTNITKDTKLKRTLEKLYRRHLATRARNYRDLLGYYMLEASILPEDVRVLEIKNAMIAAGKRLIERYPKIKAVIDWFEKITVNDTRDCFRTLASLLVKGWYSIETKWKHKEYIIRAKRFITVVANSGLTNAQIDKFEPSYTSIYDWNHYQTVSFESMNDWGKNVLGDPTIFNVIVDVLLSKDKKKDDLFNDMLTCSECISK